MIAPADIEVILLAAGQSRRMGGTDKLLLTVPGGESLLARAAALYCGLGMAVTVVLRPGQPDHAAALAGLRLAIVANADPDAVQAASARTGLAAARLEGAGLLVALADQPWLNPADITALVDTFAQHGGAKIVVPRHGGQRGNPVLLPTAVARALAADPAARPRQFIDTHPELVVWHEAAHDHFTRDIDTPADAAQLTERAP